ncbi:MAG: hypothetical protein KDK62_05575 [Chlamydiia bacterium]|nr:hypothetical protein [Chlamydiia bacterium]
MYEQNQYQWLRSIGKPLQDFYIFDWALNKDQALSLLSVFSYFNIPVYGGSVYKFENGKPKRTGDNWSVPDEFDFSNEEGIKNTLANARAYIESYEKNNPSSFYTLTTPTNSNTLTIDEMENLTKKESSLSDRVEYLVALFEQFLRKEDIEAIRELNLSDTPLALEVLTMILIDSKMGIPQRIYDELKLMISQTNLDNKIIEGIPITTPCP